LHNVTEIFEGDEVVECGTISDSNRVGKFNKTDVSCFMNRFYDSEGGFCGLDSLFFLGLFSIDMHFHGLVSHSIL